MSDNSYGLSSFACDGLSKGSYTGQARFPSPYLDYTSTYIWKSLTEVFDWAEFSYLMTPEVREAFRRLVSPFVTRLKFEAPDPDTRPIDPLEERKWRQLMEDKLQWPLHAFGTLLNVVFYGNDFISLLAPIDRYLKCPDCGGKIKLREVRPDMNFNYSNKKFKLRCPFMECQRGGLKTVKSFVVEDQRQNSPEKFKIKHWSPRDIEVRHYEHTDDTEIFLRVSSTLKSAVKKSDIYTLATLDMGILDAIETNSLFKFKPGRVFHAREPLLAGIRSNGWGMPRVTGLHKQAWMIQLMRKSVQSLALDLDHPIKVVSPAEQTIGAGGRGPMSPGQSVPASEFSSSFNRILASHRQDPTRWHSMSYPVNAQFLGGQAAQLFPYQMMAAAKEDLVDAAGMPVEMYKGSLNTTSAPMGLRLFEVQNVSLVTILNNALQFIINRIQEMSGFDPVICKHEPVKIADDLQTLALLSQLATSGQLSLTEPLSRMGVSLRDDLWRQADEQKMRQDIQEKSESLTQKKQESQALVQQLQQPPQDPAAAGGGGAPAGPGGAPMVDPLAGQLPSTGFTPPSSVDQWEPAAMALAQQLSMMPPANRNQEFKLLRDQWPTFHAIVMQRLDQARYQQGVQGRQMMTGGI